MQAGAVVASAVDFPDIRSHGGSWEASDTLIPGFDNVIGCIGGSLCLQAPCPPEPEPEWLGMRARLSGGVAAHVDLQVQTTSVLVGPATMWSSAYVNAKCVLVGLFEQPRDIVVR